MPETKEITVDQITPEQALNTLYAATRKLNLDAEQHDLLKTCKIIVEKTFNRAEIVNY